MCLHASLSLSRCPGSFCVAVVALLKAGVDLNAQDEYGSTPLAFAAQHGRYAMVLAMRSFVLVHACDNAASCGLRST